MTSFFNFFGFFLVTKMIKTPTKKQLLLILNNITVVKSSFGAGDHTDLEIQ